MVVITHKVWGTQEFKFPTEAREKEFRNMWYAMADSPKFQNKQIKITSVDGSVFNLLIRDISNCIVVMDELKTI